MGAHLDVTALVLYGLYLDGVSAEDAGRMLPAITDRQHSGGLCDD